MADAMLEEDAAPSVIPVSLSFSKEFASHPACPQALITVNRPSMPVRP
jgi:hypothetical protein